MAETYQFSLPLLAAAQAQKHVSVNEALIRLDAAAQMRVESAGVSAPPVAALDGQAWLVPDGAGGDWAGYAGAIALRVNGGWDFLLPMAGWRLWDAEGGVFRIFDGAGWTGGAVALGQHGAATVSRVVEIAHVVDAGAVSAVLAAIPAGCSVTGITARVTRELTGSAASWSLGVPGSSNRYGSGFGMSLNSYANGLTGQPQAYYSDTDLVLTPESGDFAGGEVRLAVHLTELVPPRAV